MRNNVYLLFFLVGIMLLKFNAQAQCLKTNVEGIIINREEYKKSYKVFILFNEKWTEAERTSSGFIVPNELKNEQKVSVKFVFDKYTLVFPSIKVSEFNLKWLIGVADKRPFPEAYISQQDSESIKRIYYIKFTSESGQEILHLVKEKT
jgi:hypothetical protein